MRPRPINPHTARLLPEEANDLLEILDTTPEAPPFPRIHNFAGENLMETIARMLALSAHKIGMLKKRWEVKD